MLLLQAQVRHRNFIESIGSLVQASIFSLKDTIVQISRCSFDIHMQDIVGALIVGSGLVMLRPKGTMDFDYLAGLLEKKQISFMHIVPTLVNSLFNYLIENGIVSSVATLRSLCSIGELYSIKIKVFILFSFDQF